MRWLLAVIVLAGCGSHAPPSSQPDLDPPADAAPPPPPAFPPLAYPTCAGGERLRGYVRDRATGEPLPGATVVISTLDGETSVITDDRGVYCVATEASEVTLDVYYADQTVGRVEHLGVEREHVVGDVFIDLAAD